jgi:hypothetical protein
MMGTKGTFSNGGVCDYNAVNCLAVSGDMPVKLGINSICGSLMQAKDVRGSRGKSLFVGTVTNSMRTRILPVTT